MNTRECGTNFESLAADYLQQQGLILMHRNFRCKTGEIDLIFKEPRSAVRQEQVVFVEVRFRTNNFFGGGVQSVDTKKQRKLIHSAQLFLRFRPMIANLPCRFDVVGITLEDEKPIFEWIQNAFDAH